MNRAARLMAFLTLASTAAFAQSPVTDPSLFPRPAQIEDAVAFWTRVYSEVGTNGGFIHDNREMGVVYEVVRLPDNASPRQRRRVTNAALDKYRKILNDLADGNTGAMTTDVARVRALWPADADAATYRAAAGRLRFQLGQADRFEAGLKRSGRWRPYIVDVFEANGLPRELAILPHVESSFDPTAYSKVGAAGMWQFTRSTGLRYMQIDHIIDQRRDPFMSTEAAAQLLADNYAVIESWPLALTAYNHGLAGMRRAASVLGTKDIGIIVDDYQGRTFGFASRNFYAAFLAALDVDRNYQRYFGDIRIDTPEDLTVIDVPDYIDAAPLAAALDVSMNELRRLNPALTDIVWAGEKYIPRGFPLRAPASAGAADSLLAGIPDSLRAARQRPDVQHRVRRGETLSGIADRYGVSLAALVRANSLNNRNFIREGQVLNLPAEASAGVLAASAMPPEAVVEGQYTVRRGDSVDLIARRLGVSQDALIAANGIQNRNRIYPGQQLQIPGFEAGAAVDAEQVLPAAATAGLAALPAPAEQPQPEPAATTPAIIVEPADVLVEPDDVLVEPSELLADSLLNADAPALGVDDVSDIVAAAEAEQESDLESNALASNQAVLAGDPSDYSVGTDNTIEVQAMETLGHYADWLGIRTQRLRDINRMPFGEAVVYGQRIALEFGTVDVATFEARRQQFHELRQESFFSSFQIDEVVEHTVRRGESLWVLARRTYDVPVWLLRQYNPDLDLDRIAPGTIVKFPVLRSVANNSSGVNANGEVG